MRRACAVRMWAAFLACIAPCLTQNSLCACMNMPVKDVLPACTHSLTPCRCASTARTPPTSTCACAAGRSLSTPQACASRPTRCSTQACRCVRLHAQGAGSLSSAQFACRRGLRCCGPWALDAYVLDFHSCAHAMGLVLFHELRYSTSPSHSPLPLRRPSWRGTSCMRRVRCTATWMTLVGSRQYRAPTGVYWRRGSGRLRHRCHLSQLLGGLGMMKSDAWPPHSFSFIGLAGSRQRSAGTGPYLCAIICEGDKAHRPSV